MDLRQLRHFVTVVERGSFTRAAASLSLAQSILSRSISQLEKELGHRVLYRNGRGIVTTDVGKRLLEHAYGILNQVQHAEEELLNEKAAGRAAVALGPSLGRCISAPFLMHCRRAFPGTAVSLFEGQSSRILEWLSNGRADVGLVYSPAPSTSYRTKLLADVRLHLISPARSKNPKRNTVPLQALSELPLIVLSRPHNIRRIVEDACEERGIKLKFVYELEEISGVATMIELVESGEGYTILPYHTVFAKASATKPSIVATPIISPALTVPLHIAVATSRRVTPAVAQIRDFLESYVPEHLNKIESSRNSRKRLPR